MKCTNNIVLQRKARRDWIARIEESSEELKKLASQERQKQLMKPKNHLKTEMDISSLALQVAEDLREIIQKLDDIDYKLLDEVFDGGRKHAIDAFIAATQLRQVFMHSKEK